MQVLEAKMEVIGWGLWLAAKLQAPKVLILSDSLQAMKVINGSFLECPWSLRTYFLDCKTLFANFDSITVKHVNRCFNGHAHDMTRKGLVDLAIVVDCPRWF